MLVFRPLGPSASIPTGMPSATRLWMSVSCAVSASEGECGNASGLGVGFEDPYHRGLGWVLQEQGGIADGSRTLGPGGSGHVRLGSAAGRRRQRSSHGGGCQKRWLCGHGALL